MSTNDMYYDEFRKNGYVVLKNAMNDVECHNFLHNTVLPSLERCGLQSSMIETDKFETYKAWDDEYGAVVCGEDGMHPLPLNEDNWYTFFNSPNLLSFLDKLHGGRKNWKWMDGAKYGMGWIHIRYPVGDTDTWQAPDENFGWHIDGNYNKAVSEKSVVLLPFITHVKHGGGGTAVLTGSHNHVAGFMYGKNPEKVERLLPKFIYDTVKWALMPFNNYINNMRVKEVTGNVGDILVMHPLLLHSSSICLEGNEPRITFNMATSWNQSD